MPIFRPSFARRCALIVPMAVFGFLAGCNTIKVVPPCPPVRFDKATASLTQFKPGPGRDVTDTVYQAEISGYRGRCTHNEDSVDVDLDLDFALAGGPAAAGGKVNLYYFVALPQFFPQPDGKTIIGITRDAPANGEVQRFTESNVRITIPLKENEAGAAFDIYIGFQVDAAQLEYNRRNPE